MNEEALLKELQEIPGATNVEEVAEETQELPEEPQAEEDPAESPEEPQEATPEVEDDPELDKPMSEVLGLEKEEAKEVDDSVPLAKFLELKKEISELKSQALTATEKSDTLDALAAEYDVDPNFMGRLDKILSAKAVKQVQDKYEPILKEQEQSRIAEKTDKVFSSVYEKTIAQFPELEGIANKDVVKAIALDKNNASKSVKKIIEEIYGGAIEKIESKPGASFERPSTATKSPQSLDFDNLSSEDHALIKKDPKMAEKYSEHLIATLRY